MTLPPQEAADALEEIQRARHRSATAYHDRKASPHLFLWGVIWILGYGATYAWPKEAGIVWWILVPIGFLGSWGIGRRGAGGKSASANWRFGAMFVVAFLFITALFTVLRPQSGEQAAAVVPLLIAFLYILVGILTSGVRIALVGIGVGALTLGGYFWLSPAHFVLWMAAVGGGALILGGFWMRGV